MRLVRGLGPTGGRPAGGDAAVTAIERPDPPDTPGEFIPRIDLPSDAEIKAGLRESLARIQAEEHKARMAPDLEVDAPSGMTPDEVGTLRRALPRRRVRRHAARRAPEASCTGQPR